MTPRMTRYSPERIERKLRDAVARLLYLKHLRATATTARRIFGIPGGEGRSAAEPTDGCRSCPASISTPAAGKRLEWDT